MTKLEEIARAIEPIIARPPSREDIDFGMGKYRAKEIARAAIEAMRDAPVLSRVELFATIDKESTFANRNLIWRAMIDTILNEKPA